MVNQSRTIITKQITDLLPYINNARTHSDEQVAQIAASIKEFGFNNPVLVSDDGSIIAGHGRVMAATKLGMNEVPCVELSHLSDTQRKAYILADNKLALNAEWDNELLSIELNDLKELNFDVNLIGFNFEEINGFKEGSIIDMPNLSNAEKEPFQQKAFILHDEQAQIVDDAITLARTNPLVDTGLNDNNNGNALALICKGWLNDNC